MENYRTSAPTRFDIKYHFVWTTKYRKKVLAGAVGVRLRDLIREICRANDIEILQGHVSSEHVHILVSAPPNVSDEVVQEYIRLQGQEPPSTDATFRVEGQDETKNFSS